MGKAVQLQPKKKVNIEYNETNPKKQVKKMKPKILHIITGLGVGGTEKHLLKILPRMKRTEHIVCALRSQKETGKKLEALGIKVYYLSEGRGVFRRTRNFRQIIRDEKPGMLCTYLIHADLFGRVFGKLFGMKKIICNIRVVFNDGYFREVGRLPLFIERMSSFLNTGYITNSNTAKQSLVQIQKIKDCRINVIPNGIDLQKITGVKVNIAKKRATLGLKRSDFVISCVGRLHEQKGQEYLIEAIGMLKNDNDDKLRNANDTTHIKCLLIGEGEKRAEYEKIIADLKLENEVKLLGSRDDTIEILKSSDLFVLPTNYEGMSNALLEAMACELPIITTNIPENKEVIKDNKSGLLAEPRNAGQIYEKIKTILKSKEKARAMARNAFPEVKKYDVAICAKKFEDEYIRLVNTN
jgi:glycosyltransferase involved in cell wall biosynthesis